MMSLHSNEKIISFDDTMASQYLPEENHFQQDADVPPETTHNSPKSIASQFSFVNEKHDEEKVLPILIGNLKSNHPTRDEIMDPQVISATFEDSDLQLQEQNLNNSIPHYSETKSSSKVNMSESSFEEQCAREWKAREEFEHEQRQQLEKYLKESRELFAAEMEIKMCEHQTKIIRQDLLLRRQRLEQQRKKELEARHLEQLNNSVMSHDDFTEDVEPDEQLTASRIDVHNKKMCNKLQRSNGIIDEDQVIEKYNVPNNEPTINDRNSSSLNDQALSFNSQTLQQTIQNIYNSVMNSDTEFNEGVSSNRMEVDEETANEQAGSSNQGGQVSKPYKCQHCPKQYQHRCNLITHTKIHDENKRIKCEICFKLFANTSQYRAHMNSHTGEKLHFCSVCNRGFRHRDNLMKHEKIHLRKFKSRQGGDMVAYGERKMECFQCKKKFSHIATLIRHENIHKNIRPYQCNYCGKRFTQSGNLNTHVRIHTGEKPFKCQYCGKGFARRDNTKIHMQRCEFRGDINHINHSFPALSNSPQSSSDLVIDEC